MNELEKRAKRVCTYNMRATQGFSSTVDPSLCILYNWEWTSGSWEPPPASWKHWDNFMWLSKESPYITRSGNPKDSSAQWIFEKSPAAK